MRRLLIASATLCLSAHAVRASAAPVACESLATLSLPGTTVTTTQDVPAGDFTPPSAGPGAGRLSALPVFCRVALTVSPQIHIEVWLPKDTWNGSYRGAPGNGAAWTSGDCNLRVLRGGSWNGIPQFLRSSSRYRYEPDSRYNNIGFRVARTL